jgi:hypothetical protein
MASGDNSNWLGTLLSGLGSAYTGYKTSHNTNSLLNQLQNSYKDPSSLYGQYSATDKQFYNDYMANAAAQGRATDAYKLGTAREAAYNNWLGQYRTNLAQQAQSTLGTSLAANNAAASPYYTAAKLLGDKDTRDQMYSGVGQAYDWAKDLYSDLSGHYTSNTQPTVNNAYISAMNSQGTYGSGGSPVSAGSSSTSTDQTGTTTTDTSGSDWFSKLLGG